MTSNYNSALSTAVKYLCDNKNDNESMYFLVFLHVASIYNFFNRVVELMS